MDFIKEDLEKRGVPLTRENYLRLAYGDKVDPSQFLGAELESDLPSEIQLKGQA